MGDDVTLRLKNMISEINESFIKVESDNNGQGDGETKVQQAACENESSLGGPIFVPELYVQRYSFVKEVLEKHSIKSVVDFGSAQCKLMTLLKTVPSLEKIALVDKNGFKLNANRSGAKPVLGDYLHPRTTPLTVNVFEGCATMLDTRIVGYEAATLIEIIEHLYEDVLSAVTENVFGLLEPHLVIVTTPNSEFNQLFPDFQGMRHWDHKFEWNREQFHKWCETVCEKFDYEVEISGLGPGPPGSEHLGFCSQTAVFTQHSWSTSVDPRGSHCYQLIQSIEFPFKKDNLSVDDSLAIEIAYHLHETCRHAEPDLDNSNTVHVPLTELIKYKTIHNLCNLEQLREFMSSRYTLSSDGEYVIFLLEDQSQWGSENSGDTEGELDSDWVIEHKNNVSGTEGETGSDVQPNEELCD